MTCPKCQGAMRNYERNGVHVDQCTECRGIFLDKGELERLIDAENSWHAPPQARGGGQQHAPGGQAGSLGAIVGEVMHQAKAAKQGHHGQPYGSHYRGHKKKSFLDDLFG